MLAAFPPVRIKRMGLPNASTTGVNLGRQAAPRASDRLIATVFWCARRMLMSAHHGGINKQLFQIRFVLQCLGHARPHATDLPAKRT
jgi:hypothetical protein